MTAPSRVQITAVIGSLLTAALVLSLVAALRGPWRDVPQGATLAAGSNPVTPGDFTGFGFDQCHTPTQKAMDVWMESSPFLAVGVYISGDSRACRSQPNLTATWVRNQLAKGWKILPITLGPQASCQPRFPRYGDDETIDPRLGSQKGYGYARMQGRAEAEKAVTAAQKLGIVKGSTLYYDLEGFDATNTACRESALYFLSYWTQRVRALGYRSGVYSSASSGIKELDKARTNRPHTFVLPDQIWIARWDGKANTSTTYISDAGWKSARIKQYQGGHDETWGGVRINIDRNYLGLGRGMYAPAENHCSGTRTDFGTYPTLNYKTAVQHPAEVKGLKCLLRERAGYTGPVNTTFDTTLRDAIKAYRKKKGVAVRDYWTDRMWMMIAIEGSARPVLKFGSAGATVRNVQRAINAAHITDSPLATDGKFGTRMTIAVKKWEKRMGYSQNGIVTSKDWAALAKGAYAPSHLR